MHGRFIECLKYIIPKKLDRVYEMLIKDENVLLAVGMISISLGILVGRFLHFEYSGFSVSDFVEGVLIGVSLVLNLTYLIRMRSRKRD
jgi:hypothetical protein